ncbi:Crp/Fnr family transcriptional regulator, partial [Desulfobotulus mexicanus]
LLGFTWKTPGPDDLRGFIRHALKDRIRMLQALAPFSSLKEESLFTLACRMKPESFGGEDRLQTEGQPIDALRFVMDGIVETYRHNRSGWIGTVRVAGPGACTGEEALPPGRNPGAGSTVEAIEPVFAFSVSLEDMRSLIRKDPDLGFMLLEIASGKNDQAERLFVAV